MENHPIPQDVTGFQFRLIGSLTVKQFAYIAFSAVSCILVWYAPGSILIKIPLFLLLGGIGPALAFLPVEGRPMDQMAGHFVHALIRPNQFIYRKVGGRLPISMIELGNMKQSTQKQAELKKTTSAMAAQRQEKLTLYLQQIHQSSSAADKYEEAFMQNVLSGKPVQAVPSTIQHPVQVPIAAPAAAVPQPTPQPQLPPAQTPIQVSTPQPPIVTAQQPDQPPHIKPEEIQKEEQEIEKELADAKKKEEQSHSPQETQAAHTRVTELDKKLQEVLAQKALLEKELTQLKQNVSFATTQPTPPPTASVTHSALPEQETGTGKAEPGVRNISKEQVPAVGIPTLPENPNLVMGIVKDPRNNVLSNILVEIMDKDGSPVRAFKTNGLGQFAAATALPNGTYRIAFEDPKGEHQFDIVEIVASGAVIPAIEVVSHDAREALRQQLFG